VEPALDTRWIRYEGAPVFKKRNQEPEQAPEPIPAPAPAMKKIALADSINALRAELSTAWTRSQNQTLRFRPSPVELTLQAAVTSDAQAEFGVRWWLIELGGELSRQSAVTQTVKLTLDPVLYDEHGKPVPGDFLVEAPGKPSSNVDEETLEAPG
jgi:Trypsin-co-occurring domain 2